RPPAVGGGEREPSHLGDRSTGRWDGAPDGHARPARGGAEDGRGGLRDGMDGSPLIAEYTARDRRAALGEPTQGARGACRPARPVAPAIGNLTRTPGLR